MAYTLGSGRDNPFLVLDDVEVQEVEWRPAQFKPASEKKSTLYVALDSEGETELPSSTIPRSAIKKSKNGRSTDTTPGNPSFKIRNEDSAARNGMRTPPAATGPRDSIVISSDEEGNEPSSRQKHAPRRSQALPLRQTEAPVPSSNVTHSHANTTPLPERRKPSDLSTQYVPHSTAKVPTVAEDVTAPNRLWPTTNERKERTPTALPAQLNEAIGRVTPSASAGAPSKFSAYNLAAGTHQERSTRSRHGTTPDYRHPISYHENSPLNMQKPGPVQQTSANSPIRDRAESHRDREQGTPRHMETSTTSTSGRADSTERAEECVTSALSEEPRKGSGSDPLKPPQRARMVKSATSAPRHQHSTGGHVRRVSPPRMPASTSRLKPSVEQTVDNNRLTRSFGNPSNLNVTSASMGAQLSATAAAKSPTLPSVEVPSNVHHQAPKAATPSFGSTTVSNTPIDKTHGAVTPLANVLTNSNVDVHDPVGATQLSNEAELSRKEIDTRLKRHLDERYEDHAYMVKNTMWRQRTCYEREIRAQGRGPPSKKAYQLPEKYIQSTSPFASMATIQVPLDKGHKKGRMKDITQEIFTEATSKTAAAKSAWAIPTTPYKVEDVSIPLFKEYVGLKHNILADNESKLMTMPYLGDEDEEGAQQELVNKLPLIYEIRHDINALSDVRNEQCRFYADSIEPFLNEIRLTWDMILYWLLAPDSLLAQIDRNFKHTGPKVDLLDRSPYDREYFHRDEEKRKAILFDRRPGQWQELLRQIKQPSAVQLRTASLTCASVLANCKISPWYLARQTTTMRGYVQSKTVAAKSASKFNFRSVVCRVCHEHNCLFHGEIREQPQSDSDASTSEDESGEEYSQKVEAQDDLQRPGPVHDDSQHTKSSHDDDDSTSSPVLMPAHMDEHDSDVEHIINYKLAANPDVLANDPVPAFHAPDNAIPPSGRFNRVWWEKNTNTFKWEKRNPFVPCSHDGDCVDAKCRCYREGITCEKSCKCPSLCDRRFPGCVCSSIHGKRSCSTEKACLCVKFKRECDADLCGTCGATEILDPVNRYNEQMLLERCTNVGIQRGVPKKTLLGRSEVHGFGLYAGQDIEKDDIIGEYTGEVISVEESARREIIYEYEKNMYLFKLNRKQEVDATFMGNKLRFINNANQNLTNCYPKVLLCNTVFRVAIYANTEIKAGTELFFHYNYPEETTKHFKQPIRNGKVFAVKQTVKHAPVPKFKRASSRSSFHESSEPPSAGLRTVNPSVHRALAMARAAKAAKREVLSTESGSHGPVNSHKIGLKQARKSVTSVMLQHSALKHPGSRDQSRTGLGFDFPRGTDNDDPSARLTRWGADESVANLVVQDTDDDEDDDFVPYDTRAGADANDVPADAEEDDPGMGFGRQYGNFGPSGTIRPRARLTKSAPSSAPVMAVKKVKKKMGGARPGAGRKRKRPLVLNSDDE